MSIRKTRELLEDLRVKEIIVPEFQREYVWKRPAALDLITSMYKGYPSGSLIYWETNSPPKIKNDAVDLTKSGTFKVLLDGQQRLTTLYMIIKDEIPPYYREEDIPNGLSLGELCFDLMNEKFQFHKERFIKNKPEIQFIKDILSSTGVRATYLANSYCFSNPGAVFDDILEIFNERLSFIRELKHFTFPILTVPNDAKIKEAIDVFDKINSTGTPLNPAELVIAHVTGTWVEIRTTIKETLRELKQEFNFKLDLTQIIRFFVLSLTGSPKLKDNIELDYDGFLEADYIAAWDNMRKALEYLLAKLNQSGHITSSNDLSSSNVLICPLAYLFENDNRMDSEKFNGFMYWMLLAMIKQRYSGSTEEKLAKDLGIVLTSKGIIGDLIKTIIGGESVEITPAELEGQSKSHPLHLLLYIIIRNRGGVEGDYGSQEAWLIFNPSELEDFSSSGSKLQELKKKELSNSSFITRNISVPKEGKTAYEYLDEINLTRPGYLEKNLIPTDMDLWNPEKYEDFLIARRKLIAAEMNVFLESFIKN